MDPSQHPDPDCAICRQPAAARCQCESKGLEQALRQAEHRMMTDVYNEIRTWVRERAQDYILEYYNVLTARRKDDFNARMQQMTEHAAFYYRARPHPSEIAMANAELKRGIDEDWRNSVQRYPEVLEYFYSLVSLTLPNEDDPAVKDPPLSALSGGARKPRLQIEGAPQRERERSERGGGSSSRTSKAMVAPPRRMMTPFPVPQPPPMSPYGGAFGAPLPGPMPGHFP